MKKRLFSALLAIIMLLSSFAPVTTFASRKDELPYLPYIDEDGTYYRLHSGNTEEFNTDYKAMVDYFVTEMEACKTNITFNFATKESRYAYTYYDTPTESSERAKSRLYNDLLSDIQEQINMSADEYSIGAQNIEVYLSDLDIIQFGIYKNTRYYTFRINFSEIIYNKTASLNLPGTDADGKYYRESDGLPLAFNTNWDDMVEYFREAMMNRRNSITYYFATTDPKYKYTFNNETNDTAEVCEAFARDVITDVYKKDSDNPSNAAGGDYLFKSIKNIGTHGYKAFLSSGDNPIDDSPRYYTFRISLNNISYFTSVEQENAIEYYCREFSDKYIKSDATDYEKVKTIYDFVVRNTKYDDDVFNGKYEFSSERYTVAHSAYGAILGNVSVNDSYDMASKDTVTGLKVINKADQGLAVCEGYSKLFYYLCVMNGIPCRIVDGEYLEESGKEPDPHEWNYVWLDDGSGDGYKWFQVDTTFAAQKSFKEVDMNDYNYFLCGRVESEEFGYKNHQQPYHIDNTPINEAFVIYDYWGDNGDSTYISSKENYKFKKINLNSFDALESGYIVSRKTEYEGDSDVKVALIHSTKDDQYIINIDDNGDVLPTDIHGFIYNGQPQSVYEVFIPYLDINEYEVDKLTGIKDAGQYTINIKGENNTSASISFRIIPMDLDNSHEGNYEYDTLNIQDSAVYTGNTITPDTYIVDGYKNVLKEGKDYEVVAYKDSAHTQKAEIKDIGTYYVDVNYEVGNNYSGHYYLVFKVNKIRMDEVLIDQNGDGKDDDFEFPYLPESLRERDNISSPADLYKAGSDNMTIGEYNVKVDKDYSVTSSGGLSWDESGILTLTGLSTSAVIASGTKKTIRYRIKGNFDISDPKYNLNGGYADSGKTNVYTYTGKAIKPVRFDHLDSYLEQGTDYIISSYSNNTNAGEANVVIKGINGCSGTVTMHFHINKASITKAVMTTNTSGGTLKYTLTYNGTDLVKGKDYTETKTTTSTGYKLTITGINNFGGSTTLNVNVATAPDTRVRPTSSGNYITLSKSSYVYSSKANKPTVTLYNKKKKAINKDFYTVSYSNNKNVGTGKVTVKFKNGYSGTITKTFTIKPKGTTLSGVTAASKAFTVKWKKYATQTTGYEIQYALNKSFKKSPKKVAITKNSTTSKKITKLSAKKTYYVRIRTYKTVSGKKYYSSWSAAKKVTTKK